ncbi:MAG: hypothetical protein QW656_02350 [Zestosphaera sp.]
MRVVLLLAVLLVVLGVVGGSIAYFMFIETPISSSATTTPTTTPISSGQLKITDITSEGFVVVGEEIYWRIKIYGDIDLRNYTVINGVYGYWVGKINVTHPKGMEILLHEPPNYVDVVTQFSYLSGVRVLDACVYSWSWTESPWPEGTYEVIVWLKGPYENRTVLFKKSFNFSMSLEASVTPTTWESWNETLRFTIRNEGDVPIIVEGADIILVGDSGIPYVIGWWEQTPPTETIMPGETRVLVGPALIRDDYKEELKGKTATVKIVLGVASAPREYSVIVDVKFPS